ncbi:MAG: DUF3857 domain-containing transglutaminase family protein [Pseudobdellovibrionaceae bacterium]
MSDGQITYFSKTKIKILNESGRDLGTLRFNYHPQENELKISNAEVHNESKVIKVDAASIVDQPIRGSELGFDDTRQVMVSFPQVQVGSELFYEFKEKTFHPRITKQYSDRFEFGDGGVSENTEYKISSQRKLYFHVNDPANSLEVIKNETEKNNVYFVRLKKPVVYSIFDEVRNHNDDRKKTWVIVSSEANHELMFKPLAEKYETILHSNVPEKYQDILNRVKDESEPIRKIAQLLSLVSERTRYMGDWRPRGGGLLPRSLEKIAETQSGDCKDLSILMTRLLRELGFKAWVAAIYRGTGGAPTLHEIPFLGAFNHAIVFVQLDNKKLWLDPTNFQSFPEGVFEDIGDRQALILNPENISIENVEFPSASFSIEKIYYDTTLSGENTLSEHVIIDHTGAAALHETGQLLRFSREQFEEGTIERITSRSDVLSYKVRMSGVNSRIVQPVNVDVSLERHWYPAKTSVGLAINIPIMELVQNLIRVDSANRESDFLLEIPRQVEIIDSYKNIQLRGSSLRDCVVVSPWLDYSLSIGKKPIKVTRKMEIKKHIITGEDIKSKDFLRFQKDLKECGKTSYLIFDRIKKK